MTSPSGTPQKKMSKTTSFIQTTNPEILKIQPRPGGLVPIKMLDKDLEIGAPQAASTPRASLVNEAAPVFLEEKVSKDFRVHAALDETESLGSEDVTVPNPLKDAMYVLGVAISTLMMMAADYPNIPKDNLEWTEHCLEHVRDEFGNHPPNVQGVLNHLKCKSQAGAGEPEDVGELDEEASAPEEDNEGEQTVRTTTKVKMGQ